MSCAPGARIPTPRARRSDGRLPISLCDRILTARRPNGSKTNRVGNVPHKTRAHTAAVLRVVCAGGAESIIPYVLLSVISVLVVLVLALAACSAPSSLVVCLFVMLVLVRPHLLVLLVVLVLVLVLVYSTSWCCCCSRRVLFRLETRFEDNIQSCTRTTHTVSLYRVLHQTTYSSPLVTVGKQHLKGVRSLERGRYGLRAARMYTGLAWLGFIHPSNHRRYNRPPTKNKIRWCP